ncbi:putative aminopeptidase [Janthinobacterium sp. CG_23.3]|uniref:aminopeptidase n=1 Tax=unclassified Janthinobacterium TaxID=2610881 RepID=UPI0003474C47|nr:MULTISPECIES: aminopeptidase [unclassified Janthinobacterium]MEC5164173.1 putative aminopeptidase [Janthinobacterium sp. CG_S6]
MSRIPSRFSWPARLLVAGALAAAVGGCAQLSYYAQAAQGQYSLWSGARSIDDWLGDPGTDAKLRARLAKAREIRAFAVSELGLPDNGSYKNYAALKRPYVLWNVVATPELSLSPLQWCFPIAGCVQYRGYYGKEAAQDYAAELRAEHYDVQLGGVPAYSTLGWFDDPLLSTFINYNDAELARLIFHELAHQQLYVPGDSRFNESFASAVEEAGVKLWLERFGNAAAHQAYLQHQGRRQDFLALLLRHREALKALYAGASTAAHKRAEKARIFAALKDEYQVLKTNWGGYAGYDRWFAEPLSNAHLASVATYNDFLPAFQKLLQEKKTFRAFYAAVHTLAERDKDQRHRALLELSRP